MSAENLGKESDVFLVDHAWTFRLQDSLKQVRVLMMIRASFNARGFEIIDYGLLMRKFTTFDRI